MQLFHAIDELPPGFSAGAVTIGNFDGVHRGHARILQQLNRRAAEVKGPSVVFTFEPHPVRLLRPDAAPAPLTWVDRKAELLSKQNVDVVIAYPTSLGFLALSPQDYFQQIVCEQLRTRAIVEGPNFFFGRDRQGNVGLLRQLCEWQGISLDIVDPLRVGGDFVSSSRVRKAIATGDVDAANEMLTEPYRIRGMVTHGAGRGATIGFATANISAIDTLLPGLGVYAGIAHHKGASYAAAVNVGPNPTFGEDRLKVEAHLIEFAGALYGEPLEVDFIHRLRDIQSFESAEQLKEQLAEDVAKAARVVLD